LLWYLSAVLEVFTKAIWFFAYQVGKKKMENIKELHE
jgi:hypothetical protein